MRVGRRSLLEALAVLSAEPDGRRASAAMPVTSPTTTAWSPAALPGRRRRRLHRLAAKRRDEAMLNWDASSWMHAAHVPAPGWSPGSREKRARPAGEGCLARRYSKSAAKDHPRPHSRNSPESSLDMPTEGGAVCAAPRRAFEAVYGGEEPSPARSLSSPRS